VITIIGRIKAVLPPGARIPKPQSYENYQVVRWDSSRGEEALVYRLPIRPGTKKPSEKRIPASAFITAYEVLQQTGKITRDWFRNNFPKLEADGTCNFTAIGGIFELLGEAFYAEPGIYRAIAAS
jgi:hypothetical protein